MRASDHGLPFAYLGLALAIVILLLPTTLRPPEPPPPTSQELSPDAPDEQPPILLSELSRAKSGTAGTTTAEGPAPGVGTGPPVRLVPSTRKCFGDPPRQIEDPQSPPCVPFWQGDNGGGTARGVTRNEIRIGVIDNYAALDALLEQFFNKRFEFYGRQLRLINLGISASGNSTTQRSDAARAESQQIFASLNYTGGGGYSYQDELAVRKVLSVTERPQFTGEYMRSRAPYVWSFQMEQDREMVPLGEMICARLAGRAATHAGPGLAGLPRVYGLLVGTEDAANVAISADPMVRILNRCGVRIAETVRYGSASDRITPSVTATTITRFRQAGVTTVICVCHTQDGGFTSAVASGQGFYPEWVVSSYMLNDYNNLVKLFYPPEQREHVFGLTTNPKQVALPNRPMRWAVQEINPESTAGTTGPLDEVNHTNRYRTLLLLASGIQMAGPRLTPESFERGLQRTVFPNPEHPIMAGKVGFPPSAHGMTLDAAEIWWSNTAPDPANGAAGAFCYVDRGERRTAGSWPRGEDPFFAGECDSGANVI